MRKFLKACRECWIVTLLIVVLLVANSVHMITAAEHGDYSMPFALKLLDIF